MNKIRFLVLTCILGIAGKINAQQQVSETEARNAAIDTVHNDALQPISNFKRHSIYAELLGNSFFYSVNYDYLFRIYKNDIKLAVGTGIGYFSYGYLSAEGKSLTIHYFYFTPEVNFLFGKKSHYFETGMSLTSVIPNGKYVAFVPNGRIGYRYQPQKGGFLFRIAYTPAFTTWGWIGYCWFGVSFGYIF